MFIIDYLYCCNNNLTALFTHIVPSASPTGLQIVHVAKQYATVVWEPIHLNHTNGALLGYKLGIREHVFDPQFFYRTIPNRMGTKYTFKCLFPCTKYYVKVAAFNSAGIGSYSHTEEFSTKGGLCYQIV